MRAAAAAVRCLRELPLPYTRRMSVLPAVWYVGYRRPGFGRSDRRSKTLGAG